MALRIVRLGEARRPREGLRIGTVRHLPRGVRKSDYARKNFFDVWLPQLSPSTDWISAVRGAELTDKQWAQQVARFRRRMQTPECRHLLDLLAQLSKRTDLSIGCYCENEARCHRSILRELLKERGAKLARK